MLWLAGILFVAAMLPASVDWWMQNASVDFAVPVRLLLLLSAARVGLNAYLLSF